MMTRMAHSSIRTRLLLVPVLSAVVAASSAAQTHIEPHKNSYSPKQDVELGLQAAGAGAALAFVWSLTR